MPLVYACIAPHGGELIPALAGNELRRFSPTRRGMRRIAKSMRREHPETIVIASPHNLRIKNRIGVVISQNTSGRIIQGEREVKVRAKCDFEFGNKVLLEAERRGIPVVGANFGTSEGPLSDLPMDWGTLVPLWFMNRGPSPRCKVSIVTPSRELPLGRNFDFGKVVGEMAERSKRRIAFVASADQAHAHKKSGPYGFDSRAAEYDRRIVEAVREDNLSSLMKMRPDFVEGAKPDSLWQMVMLAGVLSEAPMVGELVSYHVPTYYGMLCASYVRKDGSAADHSTNR